MSSRNYIKNVAIVGAGGNSGKFICDALLGTGKHVVTAITRTESTAELPSGAITKRVDYDKPHTIVEALRDQDALVITLSGAVPHDTQDKLVRAAAEAGVPWILPNEWSPDTAHDGLIRDVFVFASKPAGRKLIADMGNSSFIAVSTGFWYEWSLAIPSAFGIDLGNRTATLFDNGETKISISTWSQVGRAVAALLSLPIMAEDSEHSACLEAYKNRVVYVKSFTVNQKEMLASAIRVTGTKESDWTVKKEPSAERYQAGIEQMQKGERIGFAKMMYTRVFYPDGCGDTEHNKGVLNSVLGLPEEDLDAATNRALERYKEVQWP